MAKVLVYVWHIEAFVMSSALVSVIDQSHLASGSRRRAYQSRSALYRARRIRQGRQLNPLLTQRNQRAKFKLTRRTNDHSIAPQSCFLWGTLVMPRAKPGAGEAAALRDDREKMPSFADLGFRFAGRSPTVAGDGETPCRLEFDCRKCKVVSGKSLAGAMVRR